ncbi:hypothetical protein Tco_0468707 [Tanacetum coccineum]
MRVVYAPILDINYFLDILQNYDPIDDEPMWAANRVVAPTPGFVIIIPETANEFTIKGNYLTLIKGNQFDGRTKSDPHKHIHEFLGICDMFKYRDTKNEAVRLMMFPLSLTRGAKTWLDKLNEGTIKINCHGHNLSKGNIIKIFYHGLNETIQEVLNAAVGGIFLYKTPNQAYQLLEDKISKTNSKQQPKNHQASIQNLEAKFDRLANKQSGRPSGSLSSNTQPSPKGSSSIPYQPLQARNEHVNAVFTRSGKSYDPPNNPNDQNDYETPINFDTDDEDDEPTPQPKPKTPKPVKEIPIPKPYKPKIPYPQRLRKEKMEAQYGKFLYMIRAI